MEEGLDDQWENLEDIPPIITPFPILQPDDLDYNEAQCILKEEDIRIKRTGVDTCVFDRPAREGLEGPPLSLDQCKALVPDIFVRTQLFRPSDPQRQKNPKRKYPPSLSQLQHVNLSKIILERFIEKKKCLPNHGQIPIYFVQHLYCEKFLHKEVNWDDKGAHGGVAMGRPADKKRAGMVGTTMQRTKPIVLTTEEHANVVANAAEGITLASQGRTAVQVLQELQEVKTQNETLRAELKHLKQSWIQKIRLLKDIAHFTETCKIHNPPHHLLILMTS